MFKPGRDTSDSWQGIRYRAVEPGRDVFLFSCFNGLAYADVKKLNKSEIIKGVDGEMWIVTKRLKTDTPTRVPLLPAASDIVW